MEDGGEERSGVEGTKGESPGGPGVLEYRRAQRPGWSFRLANFVVVPFSVGTGVGAAVAAELALAVTLRSAKKSAAEMLLAFLIVWLVVCVATAALSWLAVGIRQVIDRKLLAARPDKQCFWWGTLVGAAYVLIVWWAVGFETIVGAFDERWIWALPLVGPVVASVSLVRVVGGAGLIQPS